MDQSPAQYIGPDWQWGQKGCYDVESFIRLCCGIQADPEGSAAGLITGCLNHTPDPEDAKMLAAEANKCPPYARIEIMRDHTNLDWRDFIPHINLPTLVCVAKKSNIFDWHGSAWVGENIPGAKTVFFEDSGHMLFWDEADKFNKEVADFVCNH